MIANLSIKVVINDDGHPEIVEGSIASFQLAKAEMERLNGDPSLFPGMLRRILESVSLPIAPPSAAPPNIIVVDVVQTLA